LRPSVVRDAIWHYQNRANDVVWPRSCPKPLIRERDNGVRTVEGKRLGRFRKSIRHSGDKVVCRCKAVKTVGRRWELGRIEIERFFEILVNSMLENCCATLTTALANQKLNRLADGVCVLKKR
jgi:hypothetical protein